VVSAREVGGKPITTLVSGPAAGVLAAAFIGELAGYRNLLTLDAGGTSTDVCLVEELTPHITTETKVDQYPVKTPMLDIVAVGTGGGSIAWSGPRNSLKVGPQSAGAVPGPMCYGRGGDQPTVTDANLVLGRIPPRLLGGEVPLDAAQAEEGIRTLGEPLGLSTQEAAAGILEIAAWNQSHGIRQVTVQKGHDPADYCLVAFGGSGGLLAGQVADALGITTVLLPENPGNVSAFGLQVSDVRRDYVRTLVRRQHEADPAEVEAVWRDLEASGRTDLAREGVEVDTMRLIRSADARYVGEASECSVRVNPGTVGNAAIAHIWDAFHATHEQIYGFSYRGEQEVEIVNLRVQAIGEVNRPPTGASDRAGDNGSVAQLPDTRSVWFDSDWADTPIYDRAALPPSSELAGPAIVEEFGSTSVVFPGWTACVDRLRNLVMTKGT
jgi:N-methylhydantoinase A